VNALYGAKSIRMVVIFPIEGLTYNRSAGLKEMATIINKLCPDFKKIHKSMEIYIN
jgi:hypothetical protein